MSKIKEILTLAIILASAAATLPAKADTDTQGTEVVVRGVKRVKPTGAPPAIDLYAKLPHMEQIALSPDGSRLAFTTHIGEMHILVGYRFSDHQHVYYKLGEGNVSGLTWADEDHVLLSDARLSTRGTCEASASHFKNQISDAGTLSTSSVNETTSNEDMAASSAVQSHIQALLEQSQPPRCQYFGIRGENTITSVNMLTGKGIPIGLNIGDAPSLALGLPARITIGGQPQLVGSFLEMREHSSGAQPAQRVFLWKVDPGTGHGKLLDDGGNDIERESRYVDDWLFNSDGTLGARTLYDFLHETYRIEIKKGGKWMPVLTREINRTVNTFAPLLIAFSGDGKSLVILDSDTHGKDLKDTQRRFHYYALKADGTYSAPLETGEAGQNRPIFDPSSGRLAGFASQTEVPIYDIREPSLQGLYDKAIAAAAPGQTEEILSVTEDSQKLLVRTTGVEDTGSYYLLNFATGSSTIIGEDFPQIPTDWIAGQEVFTYTAKDGTTLNGILTLPPKPSQKTLPLVVLPHDGPEGQDSLGFNWLVQALSSRGYLVFQPNYRGSDGRGADFVAAGYGQWAGKILSDIKDGVDALVQQGQADSKHICMIGIGFGGYAALKAAETGDINCAASVDGITDAKSYLDWRKAFAPVPDPDSFANLSPSLQWPRTFQNDPNSIRGLAKFIGDSPALLSPSAVKSPVLLIHQESDPLVPVSQSRHLYEELQKTGKQVEYLELKSAGHTPDTEAVRLQVLQKLTTFLSTYNPATN